MDAKSIWSWAQNKPALIAADLEDHGVAREVTMLILLQRGVFKWFAVRRDLIRLKNAWRDRLTACYQEAGGLPRHAPHLVWLAGYTAALQEARAALRGLCHSERWRAPDNDRAAQKFLADLAAPDA